MSFETIKIHRKLNVVNGFIQAPNNLESRKSQDDFATFLASNSCVNVVRLGAGTGRPRTAGTRGCQEILELPGVAVDAFPTICNGTRIPDALG